MAGRLNVRLETETLLALDRLARMRGKSRSEIVGEAIRRHVALAEFERIRSIVTPYAETQGYFTDDDVLRVVS